MLLHTWWVLWLSLSCSNAAQACLPEVLGFRVTRRNPKPCRAPPVASLSSRFPPGSTILHRHCRWPNCSSGSSKQLWKQCSNTGSSSSSTGSSTGSNTGSSSVRVAAVTVAPSLCLLAPYPRFSFGSHSVGSASNCKQEGTPGSRSNIYGPPRTASRLQRIYGPPTTASRPPGN